MDAEFEKVYPAAFFRDHRASPQFDQTFRLGMQLARMFHPRSVLDVGCGIGSMLWGVYCGQMAVPVCNGVEHPTAIETIKRENLNVIPADWFIPYDLVSMAKEEPTPWWAEVTKRDLTISTETAEHLPGEVSDWLVNALTTSSDTVVFSGAVEGQGGVGHVNERPDEYWRDLFEKHGFVLAATETDLLQRWMEGRIHAVWWYRNIRVYVRDEP